MNGKWLIVIAICVCAVASAQPVLPPGTAVNAADYSYDTSPGALVSIFGDGLAPELQVASTLPLPTTLAGTSVEATNGNQKVLLPLIMVSPGQINAQLPYDLGFGITIRVKTANGEARPYTFRLNRRAPKLFTWNQDGKGPAVVTHAADNSPVEPDNPVQSGEWITIWANSLGEVNPPIRAGEGANDGSEDHPLNRVTGHVRVLIGGQEAEVSYAGLAPYQAGLYQINVRAPDFEQSGVVEIKIIVDEIESQGSLTMPVKPETF